MILRLAVSFGADSALPRDRFVITPHFRDTNLGPDTGLDDPGAQGLVDDLAAGLATWFGAVGTQTREVTVKAYDAEKLPPSYPLATAVANPNTYPASAVPREVAVCLSFYNERNIPRHRGRLYIPAPLIYGSGISENRPGAAKRDAVASLVPILTGLGGVDVDWGIWSRRDRAFRPATHFYVDDEFDVVRRRGLRSVNRTVGTTSEAGIP